MEKFTTWIKKHANAELISQYGMENNASRVSYQNISTTTQTSASLVRTDSTSKDQ
jgi:hypothetical protein